MLPMLQQHLRTLGSPQLRLLHQRSIDARLSSRWQKSLCRAEAPAPAVKAIQAPAPVQEVLNEQQPLELPHPQNTRIKTAVFVKSSPNLQQCPPPKLPEFAVIGRSNVGKSSLINMLTGKKGLALVSKTPGKTQYINHFLINNSWYLVDLPGYGYAKRGKDQRLQWNAFTRDYFLHRETLANVLLLIDASIPPTEVDLACTTWLAESKVPFSLVFTKTDKRKKGLPRPAENIAAFKDRLDGDWQGEPYSLETSAATGQGRLELQVYIATMRELLEQEQHAH